MPLRPCFFMSVFLLFFKMLSFNFQTLYNRGITPNFHVNLLFSKLCYHMKEDQKLDFQLLAKIFKIFWKYSLNIPKEYLHLPRNPEILFLNSGAITIGRQSVKSKANTKATLTATHLRTDSSLLPNQISARSGSYKYSMNTKSDSLLSDTTERVWSVWNLKILSL